MGDNKRTSRRYDRRLEIEYAVGAADAWTTSLTKNVSLGGCYVETPAKLAFGARVRLRFRVPTQKEAVERLKKVL